MCFQMLYRQDYIEEPDVTQKFEIVDAGGPIYEQAEMLSTITTTAKIWLSNHVVAKAIATAEADGRVQEVKHPRDIPEMWERGVLFTDRVIPHCLEGVWHREVMWLSPHIALCNKYVLLQLKDFSYAATWSLGEIRDDPEPMGVDVLMRRECRVKFGLESEQAIIYTLPEGWSEVELERLRMGR